MAIDFRAPFGEDLLFGPLPDLNVIGSTTRDFDFIQDREELIQRIIRRLLTTRGEWIPFPEYGASLRLRVNEPLTPQLVLDIRSTILSQLMLEPDVARSPAPQVLIAKIDNGIVVTIQLFTQALRVVNFSFNPASPALLAG